MQNWIILDNDYPFSNIKCPECGAVYRDVDILYHTPGEDTFKTCSNCCIPYLKE